MQNASGVTLSLGNVNFSNPINPNQHEGWDLSEVTSTVSAEVIPEPSSFAFIAGLIAFACIAYRRKRTKA